MKKINVLEQKFITCLMLDGNISEKNICEVLEQSHRIKDILDSDNLFPFAIQRLLSVLLYRSHDIVDFKDWKKMWDSGKFNMDAINNYLLKWQDRFYLNDDKHPFMQSSDLKNSDKKCSIFKLEFSSTSQGSLFDHRMHNRSYRNININGVIKNLINYNTWFVVTGQHRASLFILKMAAPSNGSKSAMAMILKGQNLFETLCYLTVPLKNLKADLCVFNDCPENDFGRPVWELDNDAQRYLGKSGEPYGPMHYLTFPAHPMLLVFDENGNVEDSMLSSPGLPSVGKKRDPFNMSLAKDPCGLFVYIEKDNAFRNILRYEISKKMWTNAYALLEKFHGRREGAYFGLLNFYMFAKFEGCVNVGNCSVDTFGMLFHERGAKEASLFDSFHLEVPDPENVRLVDDFLYEQTEVPEKLWTAFQEVIQCGFKDKDDTSERNKLLRDIMKKDVFKFLEPQSIMFWQEVNLLFNEIYIRYLNGEDPDAEWKDGLKRICQNVSQNFCESLTNWELKKTYYKKCKLNILKRQKKILKNKKDSKEGD